MIGKQRFQAGLRRLAKDHRFHPVTFAQAMAVIAGNRPRDREVLQKIFSADHMPSGRMAWQQGNGIVDIAILTNDTPRLAPPPVQIRFANGTRRWVALMPAQDGYRGRYASRSLARSVEVDPLIKTTWVAQGLADEAVALAPVTAMLRDWNYGEGDRARAAAARLAAATYGNDPYAIRFRATIVLAEMIEEEGNPKAAITLYQRALAEPSQAQDQVASTWRKLARAARAAGNVAFAEEAGQQAVAASQIEAARGDRCSSLQPLWTNSGSATSLRPDSFHD